MSTLVQGVLADNSVTPDVDIQQYKSDSVRTHLKNAINTASTSDFKQNQVPMPSSGKTTLRSLKKVKPNFTSKPNSSHSRNEDVLVYEIAKLSNKLDSLERNTKTEEQNQRDERTLELEKKMDEITAERLRYLEKLQHEQEQWKSQYFQTIKKMNQVTVPPPAMTRSIHPNLYGHYHPSVEQNTIPETANPNILQTPLPRRTIPQPTSSEQLGNGQFLKNILDQCNASTPDVSHVSRIGPVDTVPVRLSAQKLPVNESSNMPIPSPINPSASKITKEIENEAERRKISEKFPDSLSEYFPNAKASPVSHLLTKTVPPSSLVEDFRSKLRKLVEMRSNLENNLQAAQKRPKLDDFANAVLLDQLGQEDQLAIGNERLCWIQKVVDEQITSNAEKVKEDVALELQAKNSKKSDLGRTGRRLRFAAASSKQTEAASRKPMPTKKKPSKEKYVVKEMPQLQEADESIVTHVYGKAKYHPHRSTVHDPFMHLSPVKSPKFRTKRALQAIPATYVRSEKTQTNVKQPTFLKSRYLAPTAISLGPPRIHENEPDPVIIPCPECPKRIPEVCDCDELPECSAVFDTCVADSCSEEEIQVDGESICPLVPDCPLVRKIASPVKCKLRKSPICKKKLAATGSVCPLDKVKCWVEQEVMARILGQMYDKSPCQGPKPVCPKPCYVKKLIEDELCKQIRQRLSERRPKEEPKQEVPVPQMLPPTPLLTPQPSLTESCPYASTPPRSPESVCECLADTVSVDVPPSSREEPAINVVEVATPRATPIPLDVESPREEEEEEVVVVEPSLTFIDPWEGKDPNDLDLGKNKCKINRKLAPEPEARNLLVRTITPEPSPKKASMISSESASSDSSTRSEDRTISRGQLVIEHGEMLRKKRLPLEVPSNLEDLLNQSTLRDVDDFDPASEGEFRPHARPPVIPRRPFNIIEDDPTGVYARPRQPGATGSDPEDLSVGEVPSKQRNRFDKWKASKRDSKAKSPPKEVRTVEDAPLAVDDLSDATLPPASDSSGQLAPNVIRVTSATPRALEQFRNNPIGATKSDPQVRRDSAQGSRSKGVLSRNNPMGASSSDPRVRRDSTQGRRSKVVLNLPSTEALSGGASDTEDISVHDV